MDHPQFIASHQKEESISVKGKLDEFLSCENAVSICEINQTFQKPSFKFQIQKSTKISQ